ncbi:lipolysis-stimulated lipoprotein receptor-like [Bufo gargarizans]|uniref:lipolysis-stimulated lipoprotein receptor-like n=1 Tax=Bufo gargarizans TaxID=30331 RepID=UPI001CF2D0DC|nr:lipolysis-stimulated lipoprotein receptor-like [Bufo gargarizans]
MQVTVKNPFNVVIFFQPVMLQCDYVTSAPVPPIVTWKFKSFCRDRIADALNSSSINSTTRMLRQQAGYNPNVECPDSTQTVRMVATKQSNTVTLGPYYQGRKITINNNGHLIFDHAVLGDSGVYTCAVFSPQDLSGNNEAYAELFVLGSSMGMQVTVKNPFNVVILFQPVTLQCDYVTSSLTPPIVIWKFKSFCRDRIADAFNPSSLNTTNNLMQQAGYNPYVECPDSTRTVRMVASKQSNTVTLGPYYQGRKITINNNADLTFEQTFFGDSGVYYCTVFSPQDLSGNNEAYAELLVLGHKSKIQK